MGEGHTPPPPGTKDRNGEGAQRETEAERHGQGKAESHRESKSGNRDSEAMRDTGGRPATQGPGGRGEGQE